jgi:hypothetical protein
MCTELYTRICCSRCHDCLSEHLVYARGCPEAWRGYGTCAGGVQVSTQQYSQEAAQPCGRCRWLGWCQYRRNLCAVDYWGGNDRKLGQKKAW